MINQDASNDFYFAVHSNGVFTVELPQYMGDSYRERISSILYRKGFYGVALNLSPNRSSMDCGLGTLPVGGNPKEILFTNSFWELIKWMNSMTMQEPISLMMSLDEVVDVLVETNRKPKSF